MTISLVLEPRIFWIAENHYHFPKLVAVHKLSEKQLSNYKWKQFWNQLLCKFVIIPSIQSLDSGLELSTTWSCSWTSIFLAVLYLAVQYHPSINEMRQYMYFIRLNIYLVDLHCFTSHHNSNKEGTSQMQPKLSSYHFLLDTTTISSSIELKTYK